ncbi:hypothetical protein IAD21_06369 [Abditibacteriota bacterium]|nr:hypothetical protein IAD21_06369 [Abditibacteriota bacterium]
MSASENAPMLAGLLRRTLCPTPMQTLLLKACLDGDLEAWERWSRAVGDPKSELGNDTTGIKRLVPLLYTSLRNSGAPLGAEFLSYLRAAYMREDLRSRTFRRVCAEALGVLAEAEIPFVVLKGVSLAESAYPAWALRHCHDVDLLVGRGALSGAVGVLREFRVYSGDKNNTTLVHPTHLPVSFHVRLFEDYENPAGVYEEALETSITGVNVRVLAPHHELLHLCVHAASNPSRRMLLWVADAIHLLRQAPSLDWKTLVDAAQGMALPTYVMLSYLREEIGADVPAFVSEALARPANCNRGKALRGAATTAGYRGLIREAKGGREKIWAVGWCTGQIPAFCGRRMKRSGESAREKKEGE